MVFLPTGPGPRTARVQIVQNGRGRFRWEFGETHGLRWHGQSIDAQRDGVNLWAGHRDHRRKGQQAVHPLVVLPAYCVKAKADCQPVSDGDLR